MRIHTTAKTALEVLDTSCSADMDELDGARGVKEASVACLLRDVKVIGTTRGVRITRRATVS